jgi:hypothetical protein
VLAASACAAADIYKCVDDAGAVSYTSTPSAGCSKLGASDRVSTVPADPAARRRASGGTATPPGVMPSASSPRSDGLERELADAERELATARKALAEQEAQRSGDEANYQRVLERLAPFKDKVAQQERAVEDLKRRIADAR